MPRHPLARFLAALLVALAGCAASGTRSADGGTDAGVDGGAPPIMGIETCESLDAGTPWSLDADGGCDPGLWPVEGTNCETGETRALACVEGVYGFTWCLVDTRTGDAWQAAFPLSEPEHTCWATCEDLGGRTQGCPSTW